MNSFFTSTRERNFWLFSLVVIIAIYSTIGLARTLDGFLRERAMMDELFILGFFLILLAIVLQGFKVRPSGAEIAAVIGIMVVYFFIFLRMTLPIERSHVIEYSIVGLFIYEALLERKKNGRKVFLPPILAIFLTTIIGAFDEIIQLFVPSRVFDWRDILFNFIAAVLAIGGSFILNWIRKLIKK